MYFTVLWIVFGNLFKLGVHRYPLYLLIGIVLYTFLADGVTAALPSIVSSAPTLRRISFPPIVIPLASTLASAMTFLANCAVVAATPLEPSPTTSRRGCRNSAREGSSRSMTLRADRKGLTRPRRDPFRDDERRADETGLIGRQMVERSLSDGSLQCADKRLRWPSAATAVREAVPR